MEQRRAGDQSSGGPGKKRDYRSRWAKEERGRESGKRLEGEGIEGLLLLQPPSDLFHEIRDFSGLTLGEGARRRERD